MNKKYVDVFVRVTALPRSMVLDDQTGQITVRHCQSALKRHRISVASIFFFTGRPSGAGGSLLGGVCASQSPAVFYPLPVAKA